MFDLMGFGKPTGVVRLTIRDGRVVRDQWWPAWTPIQGGVPQPLARAERPAAVEPDVQAGEFVGTVRRLGPAVRQRMLGVSHRPAACPLAWDDLRMLRLS